jgi:hypothetical protein
MSFRCEAWRYSFLEQAAEEARKESRRYWASADKEHPMQPMPWWPPAPEADPDPDPVKTRRGKAWD